MTADREIIFVEDDGDALYLGAKRLRAAGYEPLLAADGIEALRQMVMHPGCRRMVTDFNLPSGSVRYT